MARLPDPTVHERWSRLIQLHQQSDSTIADFCNRQGISTASFYQWRRKLRSQADQHGEFLAVKISEPPSSAQGIKVRFPCGAQIEMDARDTTSLLLVVDRLAASASEAEQ
jgi:transposase-like protein